MKKKLRRLFFFLLLLLSFQQVSASAFADNPDDEDGWDGTSDTYGQDIHDFSIDEALNSSDDDDDSGSGNSSPSSGNDSSADSSSDSMSDSSDSDSPADFSDSGASEPGNAGSGDETGVSEESYPPSIYDDDEAYPVDVEIEVEWDESFLDGRGFTHNGEIYATVRDEGNTITFITYSDVYDKDGNFIFEYKGPGDPDEVNARLVEIFGERSEYADMDAETLLSHYITALKELDDAKKAGTDAKTLDEINAKLDEMKGYLDAVCEKNSYQWSVSSQLNFGVITNMEGKTICHAGDPVIFASGDFVIDDRDMLVKSRNHVFEVLRHYSSGEACNEDGFPEIKSGFFGRGWSSNLETRLVFGSARDFCDALPAWKSYISALEASEARIDGYASEDSACSSLADEIHDLSREASEQFSAIEENALLSEKLRIANREALYGRAGLYAERLSFDTVLYCQDDGGFIVFQKSSDGSYQLHPSYKALSVSLSHENGLYCLSYPANGEKRYFYESGLPSFFSYRDGSLAQFSYNEAGQLSALSLDGKERLRFSWNGGKLSEVRDVLSGKKTSYSYADDFLSSVTDWEGDTKSFLYNGNGLLEKQVRADGTTVSLAFEEIGGKFRTVSTTNEERQTEYFSYDTEQNSCEYWNYDGDKFVFFYDDKGRTIRAEYEGQTVLEYDYDDSSRLISQTDASGRTEFSYDEAGTLILKNMLDGKTERWEYNGHFLTAFTDSEGNRLDYLYNAHGQMSDIFQNTALFAHFDYDSSSQISEITEEDGTRTQLAYDEYGNVTERTVIEPNQEKTRESWRFDERGILRSYTDALGRETEYKNSAHKIVMTTSEGLEITETYSNRKLLLSRLCRDCDTGEERMISYDYDKSKNLTARFLSGRDSAGNIIGKMEILSMPSLPEIPTSLDSPVFLVTEAQKSPGELSFDACGRLLSKIIKNPQGKPVFGERFEYERRRIHHLIGDKYSETIELNAFDEIIARIDGNGNRRTFSYDIFGRLVSERDAYGKEKRYSYTPYSLFEKVTFPDGYFVAYKYDDLGNCTESYDALGPLWRKTYDSHGRTQSVAASPHFVSQRFGYDENGEQTALYLNDTLVQTASFDKAERRSDVTDGMGNMNSYFFDEYGRLCSWRNALGKTARISYTEDGKVRSLVDFNGMRKDYSYSPDGRSFSIDFMGGGKVSYEHDAAGNLVRAKNDDTEFSFVYDDGGMLVLQRNERDNSEISYLYDAARNLIRIKSPERELSYEWGKNRELLSVRERYVLRNEPYTSAISFSYDDMGRETLCSYDTGECVKSFYDARGRLILKVGYDSDSVPVFVDGSVYDISGAKKYSLDSDFMVTAYSYDEFGRLASVSYPYSAERETQMMREAQEAGLMYSEYGETSEALSLSSDDVSALQKLTALVGIGSR